MNYGTLVKDAWDTTWHHRFLWVLGLFAGSSAGISFFSPRSNTVQYRLSPQDLDSLNPEMARGLSDAANFLGSNLALVLAAVGVLIVLGLAFAVVSLIAQGGMAWATAELAQQRGVPAGSAWRYGLRLFWRYLGLALICLAAALAIALAIGIVVAVGVGIAALGGTVVRVVVVVLGVLIGLSLALAAIPIGIAASIVFTYAQRAMAVEDVGPIDGLVAGWRVFRANLGTSLVIWLISLGLSIAGGVMFFLAMAVVVGVLAAVGAIVWVAVGTFSVPVITNTAVAVLVGIAVLWWLAAVMNTYFWSFWTNAYLRITGRLAEASA